MCRYLPYAKLREIHSTCIVSFGYPRNLLVSAALQIALVSGSWGHLQSQKCYLARLMSILQDDRHHSEKAKLMFCLSKGRKGWFISTDGGRET